MAVYQMAAGDVLRCEENRIRGAPRAPCRDQCPPGASMADQPIETTLALQPPPPPPATLLLVDD